MDRFVLRLVSWVAKALGILTIIVIPFVAWDTLHDINLTAAVAQLIGGIVGGLVLYATGAAWALLLRLAEDTHRLAGWAAQAETRLPQPAPQEQAPNGVEPHTLLSGQVRPRM